MRARDLPILYISSTFISALAAPRSISRPRGSAWLAGNNAPGEENAGCCVQPLRTLPFERSCR